MSVQGVIGQFSDGKCRSCAELIPEGKDFCCEACAAFYRILEKLDVPTPADKQANSQHGKLLLKKGISCPADS